MSTASRTLAASIAVMLAAASVPSLAQELPSPPERTCNEGLAAAGRTFVKKALKTIQKCNSQNLRQPGQCVPGDLAADLDVLSDKLEEKIGKKCQDVNVFGILHLGFPGKCFDPLPSDGFTLDDLKSCIAVSHAAIVERLIAVEFGSTANVVLPTAVRLCQEAAAKHAGKLTVSVLKAVQHCRNDFNAGRLTGFDPVDCATVDPKTSDAITKAVAKTREKIAKKCTTAEVLALDFCDPPRAMTIMDALDCLIAAHRDAADTPDPTQTDLIDLEYPAHAPPPLCGDGVRNVLEEECDRDDDALCPGQCGPANGDFPCLCLDVPRQRIIEKAAGADLDNGFTGLNHDSGIVDGGSYVVDLYDCDPSLGDHDCTVGPSCAGAPHPPCSTDAQCAFFNLGTCRRTRQALGPHCKFDVQQVCTNTDQVTTGCQSDVACPGIGNCCQKQFHGAPLPLAAGGVQVCVVNVFTEDITGTTNLQTGAGAVRMRQRAVTHLGGAPDQPCPVCGGFCDGNLGMNGGPGARTPCATDADCLNPPNHCVTESVCSYGTNADLPCRPEPPYGGPTQFFGNPSVDCPPLVGQNISGGGLDILFDPATTGTVSLLPNVECNSFPFAGSRCVGGMNQGRACSGPGDCPGGSCNEQCFCPNIGTGTQQPNSCSAACVSTGADDAQPCTTDAQCPTGFCHPADCRVDPLDTDSAQEGRCTVGPTDGQCSATVFKSCNIGFDTECRPPSDGGTCSFCEAGETCAPKRRECFVNSGIVRAGSPGVPDRTSAAIFCIASTGSSSINIVAGLPGPGALTQAVTVHETGF